MAASRSSRRWTRNAADEDRRIRSRSVGGSLAPLGHGPRLILLCKFRAYRSCYFCCVDFVADCGPCKVGVFRKGLLRVVSGAIEVGCEGADDEKPMQVCCAHGLHGSCTNLLVVQRLLSPTCFGFLLFPPVPLAQT